MEHGDETSVFSVALEYRELQDIVIAHPRQDLWEEIITPATDRWGFPQVLEGMAHPDLDQEVTSVLQSLPHIVRNFCFLLWLLLWLLLQLLLLLLLLLWMLFGRKPLSSLETQGKKHDMTSKVINRHHQLIQCIQ